MNPSEDPSDRLIDSLLHEQQRNKADEALLQEIETRLDAAPPRSQRHSGSRSSTRWVGAAAAAVVLVSFVGAAFWMNRPSASEAPSLARSMPTAERTTRPERHEAPTSPPPTPALDPVAPFEAPPSPPVEVGGKPSPSEGTALMEAVPAAEALPVVPPLPGTPAKPVAPPVAAKAGSGQGYGAGVGAPAAGEEFAGKARQRILPPAGRRTDDAMGSNVTDIVIGGLRSGDGAINRNSVDAALNNPNRAAGRDFDRENYGRLIDQPWKSPWQDAMSTFSIDVDTASYTNIRRMITEGRPVPPDAVRIEECVNYFDYNYEGPKGEGPFAVHGTLATCPWKPGHLLARVAIKGREMEKNARPTSNLVFLIDVSGSMQSPDKLPLLKRSMRMLIDQLDERDRVGMVVYAGTEGVVLEPTLLDERGKSAAIQALEKLEAGGSTNGGAGIKRAYEMASKNLVKGGVNRVVLATDGDFNVGTTGQGDLVSLVKKGAGTGVYLSVAGFGTGNLNDAMMEAITNEGNGNYFYVDGDEEAKRIFVAKLTGTLVTIAKDVKIQVEFNPGKVQAYRLIGYANRILRNEDFNNDRVDAGDIGAGHTVTAFYEIVPPGTPMPDTGNVDAPRYQKPAGREVVPSDDWLTLKLRHKHPEGDVSSLIETPLKGEPLAWEQAGNDFRLASAVALFGMKLRQMPEMGSVLWSKVEEIAKPALAEDPEEQRSAFVAMVKKLGKDEPKIAAAVDAAVPGLDQLRYVKKTAVMWYVQYGFDSEGKWSPRLTGLLADGKTRIQNRVNSLDMLNPGDVFFKDGPMAGRFKFIGITEKEIKSERTGLVQMVKFALYEDLKKATRCESQANLPEAELTAHAYYDPVAIFQFPLGNGETKEFQVEEGEEIPMPGMEGKDLILISVDGDSVQVSYELSPTEKVLKEIPIQKGD